MQEEKNHLGSPTEQIKIKRNIFKIAIILLVIILIFSIIFVINKKKEKVDLYTVNMTGEKVNSELKNVYKFIWSYDDNTITAVTTDNKKIEIAKNVNIAYSLSLDNGKLYYNYDYSDEGIQEDTRIAYIDLTKGNGIYKKDYIVLKTDSIVDFYKFGIIDNIIYFSNLRDSYIKNCNLKTGEVNIVAGAEVGSNSIGYFDKKYKKFYYTYYNDYDENGNYIDTIAIDNVDNLAEILKNNICICDKDIKVSYNKILTKSEAEVKIMYLTEDNRINSVMAKIPIVGFIDINNVTEANECDVNYEIRNIIIKPNPTEEHSIYIEIEIGVMAIVYEEKQINLIQDLYSPCENLEVNKKKITTITGKKIIKEMKQIREKVEVEDIENKNIIDVDVIPVIQKENRLNSKIVFEGELDLRFILSNSDLQMDTRTARIPFEYTLNDIEDSENVNANMDIEVASQDFVVQDGGAVTCNIDMMMNTNYYRNTNLNIMDEIQTNGEREEQDYNIIMYIVKKDDTLWKIAKKYGSTVEDIARANGIEDENKIYPGQKLFIPRYVKTGVSSQNAPMISHV